MAIFPRQFNAPDADVVLVSCERDDPTQFLVHRCILTAASPFFADMFDLPQPESEKNNKPPIIPVSENAQTLHMLLQFVYPIPDPTITTLDELVPVLGAAVKYDFLVVVETLRRVLVRKSFLLSAPTRVYAIASRFELEEEAKLASRYTLTVNILDAPLNDDLKYITAWSYHRLLDLHRRRSRAALDLLKIPDNIKCMQCNGSAYAVFSYPKWWGEYERRAKEELAVRPVTDVIFSLEFLADVASASGCQRCAGSILDSWRFLQDLKRSIDALPATI